ncbi:IMPACT family protein [Nesterenkonia xinjiangensis]|uniref:Putative YigZ family protein n=1 Tax=Nesterenkonia xinjiangensis TaxID=225327 RepID=A0A7Z0GPL3_9MICC|nr:YigZ family protein [Nesterenkonia xinjiangensis]NYJ79359.1 putative YigZ family protein [Nesterenkonia xinjiangensis]
MTSPRAGRLCTVLAEDADVVVELERRKSRFLTVLRRAETVGDAQAVVDGLRREYHSARHHCSAWVIGPVQEIRRGNDDGEPSGTAGAPMLEALTHAAMPGGRQDLTDAVAVVVRWFGGNLLGAGGLVSAYSDSVVAAVRQAESRGLLRRRRRMRQVRLSAPVAVVGRWENELRATGVEVLGTDYGAGSAAQLRLAVDDTAEDLAALEARLAQLTSGRAALQDDGIGWLELLP